MKIIVNNFTPVTVENEEGEILFQWLPRGKHRYVTEIKVNKSDIDVSEFVKQLENELCNSMRLDPKYLK
jgi:hypothetical protein